MAQKYRIRLKNERVVGPLLLAEIIELYLKKHIDGTEDCQLFPVGEWKKLASYDEISEAIKFEVEKLKEEKQKRKLERQLEIQRQELEAKKEEHPLEVSDTTPDQLSLKPQNGKKSEDKKAKIEAVPEEKSKEVKTELIKFNEFKFEKKVKKIDIDYKELARKYGEKVEEENQKTVIIRKQKEPIQDVEKTVVINPGWKEEIEEKRRIEEEVKAREEELKRRKELLVRESQRNVTNDNTQHLNLTQILPNMNAELMQAEVELENERKLQENRARVEEERKYQEYLKTKENKAPETKKRKGITPIIALAFIAIFYVLTEEEPVKKSEELLYLNVRYPAMLQYENTEVAKKNLMEGRVLYGQNTYVKRSLATQFFITSVANKFNNNEALGDLILTYAENMENAKKKHESNLTIFRLIQAAEANLRTNANVASGAMLFYKNIDKANTAVRIGKDYLRAGSPVSSKFLAYFLESLIASGDLTEARKIYDKLNSLPKKSFEVYNSIIKFAEFNQEFDEAEKILLQGLKDYPNSALLLLKKCDFLLRAKNLKEYERVLNKLRDLNNESSPFYSSQYLEHRGYFAVFNNKSKDAIALFKKSLEIFENEDLRTKLASLELSGDKYAQDLILESKIQDLLKKAKIERAKQNWELAFSYTTEAIDANPNHIDAILLQTEMQINRGHFESVFFSLNRMLEIYPNNAKIKKNIIMAYLQSFKFSSAQKALAELSQTKFSFSDEYALQMAEYYELINNTSQATRWYLEAIKRNGLNDNAIYKLAKYFMRYKQFTGAKDRIRKAIELDPKNVDYHILNSELIYEKDSPGVAIGYIRDLMNENGEDPKYLSQIAIFYSRSGQIKEFEVNYKKVLDSGNKDENLYRYLIRIAKLNDNVEDSIKYTNELLKLNPGDLKTRMEFSEYLMKLRRYGEALDMLMSIREKMESYPRVHYNMAKIYLINGDQKTAKQNALKEFKLNPTLDASLYIVGEVNRVMGNYSEAIESLEKAIAINPKNVEALMSLGWIKLKQNYYSEAFELYNRAQREDKNNAEIQKMLGYCYKASGQRAFAKERFELYLKLSPGASDRAEIESLIRLLQ